MNRIEPFARFAACWLALIASTGPVGAAQVGLPAGCLPPEGVGLLWQETFLETTDLAAAGWRTFGEPSWRVVHESLDGGNGDLFSGLTLIGLPAAVTGDHRDYVISTLVWNTEREGYFLVAIRFADPQNYYACEYASRGRTLEVFLVKVVDGVRTVLDQANNIGHMVQIPDLTYGAGRRNGSVISIGAFGDRICATVGGQVVLEAIDGDLGSGGAALGQERYHPFFDDVSLYLRRSEVPELEALRETPELRIPVPDRDEGNALLVDLQEMKLSPCTLEEREGELWIQLGPLPSAQETDQARRFLRAAGYAFEEIVSASSEVTLRP